MPKQNARQFAVVERNGAKEGVTEIGGGCSLIEFIETT